MSKFIKMKLVEEGELLRLKDKQIREYNPQIRSMSFYQNEIDDILTDSKLTADQKLALMGVAEKRFNGIKASEATVAKPIAPAVIAGMSSALPSSESTQLLPAAVPDAVQPIEVPKELNPLERRILQGISPHMKKKATEMLEYIQEYPELININDKNMEVIIEGEPIKHSNFLDLFRSLYSNKRNYTPIGQASFFSALSNMNAPTSLISNKIAWSNVLANQNLSIDNVKSLSSRRITSRARLMLRRRKTKKNHVFGPPGRSASILQVYSQ